MKVNGEWKQADWTMETVRERLDSENVRAGQRKLIHWTVENRTLETVLHWTVET